MKSATPQQLPILNSLDSDPCAYDGINLSDYEFVETESQKYESMPEISEEAEAYLINRSRLRKGAST
jgi:hypothetical protein